MRCAHDADVSAHLTEVSSVLTLSLGTHVTLPDTENIWGSGEKIERVSSGTVFNSRTEGWEERVQRRIVCPSQILTGWWNTRTTMNKLSWSGTKASGRIILNQHKNSLTKTVSDSRNWAWNSFLSLIILLTWKWSALTRIDCPDGKLTANSFRKIYSKCFPSGNVNEFCDHVFRTFDTDKNGFIDFKEFLLAIDVTSTGSPEEKLEWAFR